MGKISLTTRQENQLIEIEGHGTTFSKVAQPGDYLVIEGEKRLIQKISSDTCLTVEGAFPSRLAEDKHLNYKIERKPNSNAYIDCYSSMFRIYPIDSCVQDDDNIPASNATTLHIVLDISSEQLLASNYHNQFSQYINSALTDLMITTRKPSLSLQRFTTFTETFEDMDLLKLLKLTGAQPVGKWLIKTACLIPIQVS